jgi:predicted RNase H-like nuclease
MSGPVGGIDVYPRGWVAVRLAPAEIKVARGRQLDELIRHLEPVDVIAVDMPIGLPAIVRECDRLAREYVKPRHNSVFPTAPAAVLAEATFEAACERARELLGKGISRQTWALRESIYEVGLIAGHDARIIEVHPEVSFRALRGAPVGWPKTSWNGQAIRRQALAAARIEVPRCSTRRHRFRQLTCSTQPWRPGARDGTRSGRLDPFCSGYAEASGRSSGTERLAGKARRPLSVVF